MPKTAPEGAESRIFGADPGEKPRNGALDHVLSLGFTSEFRLIRM